MTRTLTRIFVSAAFLLTMGVVACDGGEDDKADNADADDSGDGTASDGETGESGNGETEGAMDTDPDCPLGAFDCPCNDGTCDAGLVCGPDGLCALGGSETGNPTTTAPETTDSALTGAGNDNAYDPENCEAPSEILSVEQIDGDFCATPCIEHEECPLGPEGTSASCSISTVGGVPNFCALICVPDSETCPTGSTCKPIPQQPNTGLCTFP